MDEYLIALQAFSRWLARYNLATCISQDETSTFLIQEVDTPRERVVAITQNRNDTLRDGLDLQNQAEGIYALTKAGFNVRRMTNVTGPAWKPGELILETPDGRVVYHSGGLATWTAAVQSALRWVYRDRLNAGLIGAIDE